ncbi:MAG: hypothetical protein LBE83_01625 [Propionibacteriaceae bacterium]|jgi:uncharacterized protein YukE|nr:hypothetical protein [Propionibacteriaceae bacterium]
MTQVLRLDAGVIAELNAVTNTTVGDLSHLLQIVENSTSDMPFWWKGQPAAAFDDTVQVWLSDSRELLSQLSATPVLLNKSQQDLYETTLEQAATLRRVQERMDGVSGDL